MDKDEINEIWDNSFIVYRGDADKANGKENNGAESSHIGSNELISSDTQRIEPRNNDVRSNGIRSDGIIRRKVNRTGSGRRDNKSAVNVRSPKKDKNEKKKKLIIKFLKTTMLGIVLFVSVMMISVLTFIAVNGRKNLNEEFVAHPNDITNIENYVNNAAENKPADDKGFLGEILDNIIAAPVKTNVLLMGMDQTGFLSDVNIVVSFDSVTKKIDIIFIPRDTYVSITREQVEQLQKQGSAVPYSGNMKLTELHSYAGKTHGHDYMKDKVEELLGININYYAKINIKAFRDIVDRVGGVYMDIPSGGLYYSDPEQNLYIAVPGGMQLLDGKNAEGVVRFRNSYSRGDLDRVDMQKRFMKEFFSQALNKDVIMNDIPGFLSILIDYVNTDFGLSDIPQYLTSFDGLSADKISFYTMPGEAEYVYGGWYYFQNDNETRKLIDNTILNFSASQTEDPEIPDDYEGLKIQLLNGSDKSTISSKTKDSLIDAGYYVVDGGDYVGAKTNKTRILVKEDGIGWDLKQYFNNSEVEVDPEIPDEFDIVLILGKNES